MNRKPHPFIVCVGSVPLALWASAAAARSTGYEVTDCSDCHFAAGGVELSVEFDPAEPGPGEPVSVAVTIGSDAMRAAGIAISSGGVGEYAVVPDDLLRVESGWVTHTSPKPASGGQATFEVQWTPPGDAGVANFNVAVVAANANGSTSGDRTRWQVYPLAFGCEPFTGYLDRDGDGFGDLDAATRVTCSTSEGYAPEAGDCDDRVATTYPGAPEQCNEVDDDCDGEVDEEVVIQTYYADVDGDGFGDLNAALEACAVPDGAVDNALDCHDQDATISPNADEICDYVDNNCDGETDEDARVSCGDGLCRVVSDFCGPACVPGEPEEEQCNGLDDDCDGMIDEDFCDEGEICTATGCVVDRGPGRSVADESAPSDVTAPVEAEPEAEDVTGSEASESPTAGGGNAATDADEVAHVDASAPLAESASPKDAPVEAGAPKESTADERDQPDEEQAPRSESGGGCALAGPRAGRLLPWLLIVAVGVRRRCRRTRVL